MLEFKGLLKLLNLDRMTTASGKDNATGPYPRTLVSILISVGGLAVFLLLASSFLTSGPIASAVRGHYYGVDNSRKNSLVREDAGACVDPPRNGTGIDFQATDSKLREFSSKSVEKEPVADGQLDGKKDTTLPYSDTSLEVTAPSSQLNNSGVLNPLSLTRIFNLILAFVIQILPSHS